MGGIYFVAALGTCICVHALFKTTHVDSIV